MQQIEQVELRYYENVFPDFNGKDDVLKLLRVQNFDLLIQNIMNFYQNNKPDMAIAVSCIKKKSEFDYSLYEGAGGHLQMYLSLYKFFTWLNENTQDQQTFASFCHLSDTIFYQWTDPNKYLKDASILYSKLQQLVLEDEQLGQDKGQFTYYMGNVGVYTLGCELFYHLDDKKSFGECLSQILSVKKKIIDNKQNPKLYFQLLYGVSGYLVCLLDLQNSYQFTPQLKHNDYRLNLERDVIEICEVILEQGIEKSGIDPKMEEEKLPPDFRLVYNFHQTQYVGAGHGLFGIIYLLLRSYQLNKPSFDQYNAILTAKLLKSCKASVEFCIDLQFESGNFPTSVGGKNDKLVQFCHGAPGAVSALVQSIDVFKESDSAVDMQKSAELAGNCIWKFGIIQQGFGLCHGISGNAYGFLALYRASGDAQWLYRALMFGSLKNQKTIMSEFGNYQHPDRFLKGVADFPFSLLNGVAGDICFYCDLLRPETSRFPGYEV